MSKTYISKPTVSNSRGRGTSRGRGNQSTTRPIAKMNQNGQSPGRGRGRAGIGINDEVIGNDSSVAETSGHDRIQRRDAYTVITPNEKNRQKITEGARRGEEAYERHREQNRLGQVSYVGTAGGGEVTESTARQKTVNHNKQAAFNVKMKSQQYREAKKLKENEDLDKMKADARRKSELKSQKDSDRQQRLEEDRRARNASFLDRLEHGARQEKGKKILSSTAASNYNQTEVDNKLQCEGDVSGSTGAVSRSPPVETLIQEFPEADPSVLESLLLQFNGNIDTVRNMLTL